MHLKTVILVASTLLASSSFAQRQVQLNYIEQYKSIALREMERAGIPASIKLAQGLLESNAGQSYLAINGNNHFGIKCGNDWRGRTVYREDDDRDDRGQLIESCFRSYREAEESFVDHSEFLRDPRKTFRYGDLFLLDITDYKGWAHGLRRAGYATDPKYPAKLIDIIERYELHRYDRMSALDIASGSDTPIVFDPTQPSTEPSDVPPTVPPPSPAPATGMLQNNDVRYALAKNNQTLAQIAQQSGARVSDLVNYNEGFIAPDQRLAAGTVIYLQPKRNAFRGRDSWHYVKKGETMFSISQMYGIKLDRLYRRNRLPAKSQPGIGERIKLRGWRVPERPKLDSEVELGPRRPADVLLDQDGDHYLEMGDDFVLPPPPPRQNPPAPSPLPPVEPPPHQVEPAPPVLTPAVEPPAAAELYHTVERGDTLFSLARRYGTTVEEIKRLNNMDSNLLSIGQRLRIR
jgi:LysM repeat protein